MKSIIKIAAIALGIACMTPSLAAAFTCKGILTDQRGVGLSLGDCDLNGLSRYDLKRITDLCGQPNGVGEDDNTTQCTVTAIVKPKRGVPDISVVITLLGVRRR